MSLYKYVKFADLIHILNGTIRFTQPSAFNDPFEMVPELYISKDIGPKIDLRFSVTELRRETKDHELVESLDSEYCNDVISRGIRSQLDKSIGVLCLSRNPSSFLMWSHYADSYAGAVVEFDDTHDFFTGKFSMEYRESRPKLNLSTYAYSGQPVPIAEFCTKPKDWEHEEEVRVVRNLSDCKCKNEEDSRGYNVFVMEVPPECVTSVFLGERMTKTNQRKVWELIKSREISLHLYAISNSNYEFRREMIRLIGMPNPIISPRTAHIFCEEDGVLGEVARFQIRRREWAFVNDTL